MAPPRIAFTPPLLNSATPWATSIADLAALYESPHTGAVTTRTALLHPFPENPSVHQKVLFPTPGPTSSLNTYGYSPHPLPFYLAAIKTIITASHAPQSKPFIVSITGNPDEVRDATLSIAHFASQTGYNLLVEVNLSCPNIPDKPPPAYTLSELLLYLSALSAADPATQIPVGLKTPPYTHDAQYRVLLAALKTHPGVVSFITSTNTLGSSLHLSSPPSLAVDQVRKVYQPTLSSEAGTGVGGLGGAAIHWLSLGNVATIRRMLSAEGMEGVAVIGVGGVADREGWERMLSVGAVAVGVGTALGDRGVRVFGDIMGSEYSVSS